MRILRKLALAVLGVSMFSVVPALADSLDFTFTSTLGNLGSSTTLTNGGVSLTVSGYSAPGISTDLFSKNGGTNEIGLGIANGTDREITGTDFIQLDLQPILSNHPSSVSLVMSSIQGSDNYDVWGSNRAGQPSTLLLSDQTKSTFTLSDLGQFRYISISSPGDSTVLLNAVNVAAGSGTGSDTPTGTPEPGSAGMLLLGLVGMGILGACAKKLGVARVSAS